jgi:hypothetical protein
MGTGSRQNHLFGLGLNGDGTTELNINKFPSTLVKLIFIGTKFKISTTEFTGHFLCIEY